MKTNGGDLVNPTPGMGHNGLTKKEHFAAMALQSLLSIYNYEDGISRNVQNTEHMACLAVKASDLLITELNKPSDETKS